MVTGFKTGVTRWSLHHAGLVRNMKKPNRAMVTLITKGLPIVIGLSMGVYMTLYVKHLSDRRGSRGHYQSGDARANAHWAEMQQIYEMQQAELARLEALRNGTLTTTTPPPTEAPYDPESDPDLKKILFWTVFSSSPHFYFGLGRKAFQDAGCPINKCTTFTDRDRLEDADAIVFNHNNIDMNDLPPFRRQRQVWVHMDLESPANSALHPLDGLFNMTMSYKKDADIYMPTGFVKEMTETQKIRYHHKDFAQKKKKLVAWFVSRCNTQSQREAFAEELQRYISVDIYGDCGPLVCEKGVAICYNMLQDDYKFYLSFENSLCRDYVTEKLWRPLRFEIVPIVMGSANYAEILPSHSYIDVRDFESPKALADYLMKLDKNDDLYNGYYEWRRQYKVSYEFNDRFNKGFCDLCAYLHNEEGTRKTLNNLQSWHSVEKDCHSPEQYFGSMKDSHRWMKTPPPPS